MRYILIALLFAVSGVLHAMDFSERIGPDPVLRGIWVAHAVSDDEGSTIDYMDPPVEFAMVTGTRISLGGVGEVGIDRVVITEEPGEPPGNLITLDNGNVLMCSKEPGQAFVLVQLFKDMGGDAGYVETTRYLITVNQ